ncbi:MAG TPA: hypothetical protein VG944_08445 [Fimbriimonas sp.]|nr:hypothetical protein [Fimbriimonas sp.]
MAIEAQSLGEIGRVGTNGSAPNLDAESYRFKTADKVSLPDDTKPLPITTQEELDHAIAVWKERLNLRDWEVRGRLVVPDLLEGSKGKINVNTLQKIATMNVLDPKVAGFEDRWNYDPERSVVHELIHCHMEMFWPEDDDTKHHVAEQAVDLLTRALLAAYRKTDPLTTGI